MVIGIFGIQFESDNLGVSALAFSSLNLLLKNTRNIEKIYIFSADNKDSIKNLYSQLDNMGVTLEVIPHSYRKLKSVSTMIEFVKQCDYVFDCTEGDSFSDIYGYKRYIKILLDKEMVLCSGKKLVLMPQTYGPYRTKIFKPILSHIFNHSEYIFSRDEKSLPAIKQYCKKNIISVTDMAFTLPYHNNFVEKAKTKIGINISGLLWSGGYNKKNQFQLKCNYKILCDGIVGYFCSMPDVEVYLIPHVFSSDLSDVENDLFPCRELKKKYKCVHIAPEFRSPIEAKSYISNMDYFLGSRMHSVIAAVSTGVPAVSISYSRKFSGVFEHIGYKAEVNLLCMTNEEALEQTKFYYHNINDLKEQVNSANEQIAKFINKYCSYLAKLG